MLMDRFHIRNGRKIDDPHGIDLPDDEARHYGEKLAASLGPISDEHIRLCVDGVDEDGNVVPTYEIR